MSINAWSKATSKIVDDVITIGHFEKLTFLFLSDRSFVDFDSFTLFFLNWKGNDINISSSDTSIELFIPLNSKKITSINSYDFYTVSRLDFINIDIITKKVHCSWSLSLTYILKQFLKLYVLLVFKMTQIVNQFECLKFFAILTSFWLLNTSITEIYSSYLTALNTFEYSCLHLRNHIRSLEDNTCQLNHSNQLFWRQIFDTILIFFVQIDKTCLHLIFYQGHCWFALNISLRLNVKLFIFWLQNFIEKGYDFYGIVNELKVEIWRIFVKMHAINVKILKWLFSWFLPLQLTKLH